MATGKWTRRILITVGTVAIIFATLPFAITWLFSSEFALQRVMEDIVENSKGTIKIQGAEGSLFGPLKIRQVIFEDDNRRIEANNIAMDWSPQKLRARLFYIQYFNIAELHVQNKKASDEPATLPVTLRLPVDVKIEVIHLPLITIGTINEKPVSLTNTEVTVDTRNETYLVDLKRIESPWATANAHIELGAGPPFPLKGTGHILGHTPRNFAVDLEADGLLELIHLTANGSTPGGKGMLKADIAAFELAPIQSFNLAVKDIDLHDFDASLPFTQLVIDTKGSIREDDTISAYLIALNLQPGTFDLQRLPLKLLKGEVNGKMDDFIARKLVADFGTGGQFNGDASLQKGIAQIKATTRNLNLQGLHSTLRPTTVSGDISATASGKDFAEQRLIAKLQESKLQMQLDIDATRKDNELRIATAELRAASGKLSMLGQMSFADKQAFELTGKLTNFNPGAFGKFPVADIGADLRAAGQLTPLRAGVNFNLANSVLRGKPLAGKGKVDIVENRITEMDLWFDIGNNHVAAKGAFGHIGDELAWQLNAGDLAQIDPSLAGFVKGKGILRGTTNDPAATLEVTAGNLRLPSATVITALDIRGNMTSGKSDTIDAHLLAKGVKQSKTEFTQIKADITGTRTRHAFQLTAQGNPDIDLSTELQGGWETGKGWAGQLVSFANRGRYVAQLRAPASLAFSTKQFELGAASIALAEGHIDFETLRWSPEKISTRGSLSGLSVAYLQKLFPEQTRSDAVKATLVLGGKWSLEAGDSFNGNIRLNRESGDLTLISEPQLPLGLTQLELTADIVQNRVKAGFNLEGKTAGIFNAHLETQLTKRDQTWGIVGDAPLTAEAKGDIPSLAWVGLFLNPGYSLDGRARLNFTRTGSMNKPQLGGSLEGDNLSLRIPDYGIYLRDGLLRANFEADRILLSQFHMRAEKGDLTASGSVKLGQGDSDVEAGADIQANQLSILNHPDYHLTASGNGKLALAQGKLAISGELRADHGDIRLPNNNRPTLSNDVIVTGKTETQKRKSGATPISIDLLLDVGNDFSLRGHGLDAKLRGNLRVKNAPPNLPTGVGVIRVAKGTYDAYGQTLEIDRGVISFAGPIDNPTLDILATRKNLSVEPGVAITGSALNPRVKLVSDPPVPDTEKLSWLVLGHGLEGSTGAEMELLPVAAAALLSANGNSSSKGIAQTFGLDEIGLSRNSASSAANNTGNSATTSTPAEQRVVTVGKRISSKLYLTYENGIDIASRVVGLQYEISRRWSIKAETGTRSAVDVFYTLRFE